MLTRRAVLAPEQRLPAIPARGMPAVVVVSHARQRVTIDPLQASERVRMVRQLEPAVFASPDPRAPILAIGATPTTIGLDDNEAPVTVTNVVRQIHGMLTIRATLSTPTAPSATPAMNASARCFVTVRSTGAERFLPASRRLCSRFIGPPSGQSGTGRYAKGRCTFRLQRPLGRVELHSPGHPRYVL